MAAPAWASLGSLLPSRLSPTPPVTWEVWGSAMNPVDRLSSPPGVAVPVPRVAGVILPAPAWFAGAGGVCRLLPAAPGGGAGSMASRLAAPRRLSAGGQWVGCVGGGPATGLLLRTVWATPPSALELRGLSRVVPPCAVTVQLPLPPRPVASGRVWWGRD